MIAEYLLINDDQLQQLKNTPTFEQTDLVIAWLDDETNEQNKVDLGKMWDVLHFTLTGQSATDPIDGNLVSAFMVGIESFDENGDFIAYNQWSEIAEICQILDKINIDKKLAKLQLKALRMNDIFPKYIWQDKKSNLDNELLRCYMELKNLYNKALDTGHHVLVTIL